MRECSLRRPNRREARYRSDNVVHGSGTSIPPQRSLCKRITVNCPINMFKCSVHVRPTLNPDVGKYDVTMSPSIRDSKLSGSLTTSSLIFYLPVNFLIWNCRGSHSSEFKNSCRQLLNDYKTALVVLL